MSGHAIELYSNTLNVTECYALYLKKKDFFGVEGYLFHLSRRLASVTSKCKSNENFKVDTTRYLQRISININRKIGLFYFLF